MSAAEAVRLHTYEAVASDGFLELMDALDASVAIAAGGRLFLASHDPGRGLAMVDIGLADVTALAWDGGCLWAASAWQVWAFVDVLAETGGEGEHLLLPQAAHTTGFLAVTDLLPCPGGPLITSSLFGCLARLDERLSMRPVWAPAGVETLQAGVGCHLTGAALRDGAGEPAFVTSANRAGDPVDWRESPEGRGVVLATGGEEVAGGLTVPRHPRLHGDALLLAEAGTGRVVRLDPATGSSETVTVVPGVPGSMTLAGDVALVGVSDPRRARLEGLTGGPAPAGAPLRDGVAVVDLHSGEVTGSLELLGHAGSVDAVAVLPAVWGASIAPPRGPVAQSTVVVAAAEPLRTLHEPVADL